LLAGWGYIVAFTKVLTMASFPALLFCLPLHVPSPLSYLSTQCSFSPNASHTGPFS
jgi:hypothetical protein